MFKIKERCGFTDIGAGIPPLMARFLREESGATAIEYCMVASGVAVAIAASVTNLGALVKSLFTSVSTAFN